LAVEVLDTAGKTLAGHEKETSAIEHRDSTKLAIQWKNATTLPSGLPIRLQFHLENGDLFGFVIE
jgi:hypothetical protein